MWEGKGQGKGERVEKGQGKEWEKGQGKEERVGIMKEWEGGKTGKNKHDG